jgi:hypothetical protein
MAEYFPIGVDSGDLCEKFKKIARRSHATFYSCLKLAKSNGWIVADGRCLRLNSDGSWRTSPNGETSVYERHHLEHILEMRTERISKLERANKRLKSSRRAIAAGEAAGPAIGALTTIMTDPTISTRKRVAAAEQLIAYKSPQDVADAAKAFLALVFTDPDQNIDDRLAATTALRRSEDVRIMPPIERPARTDAVDPAAPPEDLATLVARRRARQDALENLPLDDPKRREWCED